MGKALCKGNSHMQQALCKGSSLWNRFFARDFLMEKALGAVSGGGFFMEKVFPVLWRAALY